MIENYESLKTAMGIYSASKGGIFPYGIYLVTLFPFFAMMIVNGNITSFWSLLLILPFIFAMQAGFLFNTFCDAEKDPEDQNVITSGYISSHKVLFVTILLSLVSFIIFVLFYTSILAWGLFFGYLLLWLAYSGLKIRFKETFLGPFIASIVLFAGPSFIFIVEFGAYTYTTLFLVLGLLFVYMGHEIKHTVVEHDMDLSFNCNTFAVLFGQKTASLIEYISLISGFSLLLLAAYFSSSGVCVYFVSLFTILFAVSIILTAFYGFKINFVIDKDIKLMTFPYTLTKLFMVIFGCIILGFPLILIVFIAWILIS